MGPVRGSTCCLTTAVLSAAFGATAVYLLSHRGALPPFSGGETPALRPPCRPTAVERLKTASLPTDAGREGRGVNAADSAASLSVGHPEHIPRSVAVAVALQNSSSSASTRASARGVAINVITHGPNNPANVVALLHNYAANLPEDWPIQVRPSHPS